MKKTLIITMFFAVSLGAQTAPREGAPMPILGPVLCPHPIGPTVINADIHQPPAPDPADFGTLQPKVTGSVWNQTAIDKAFGHSFHFISPHGTECCIMTSGVLKVTLKALQTGTFNSASSGNDGLNIISNGQSVAGAPPWPNGATAGQTTTITINVPASALAQGHFGLYVQDDTAVLSAELTLRGCCLR